MAATVGQLERVEHEHSCARRAVIRSSPELQERERTKLAACTSALTEALHARGIAPDTASFVATPAATSRVAVPIGWDRDFRTGRAGRPDTYRKWEAGSSGLMSSRFSRRMPVSAAMASASIQRPW